MQFDVIKERVGDVPVSPLELGFVAGDKFIWEETDGGAHFKVTRHELPLRGKPEVISVTVSGEESERERIIAEFSEVLGDPADRDIVPGTAQHIDTILWWAPEA